MTTTTLDVPSRPAARQAARDLARNVVIGLVGFLTLVDLFAAQAILPTLVETYGVSRAAMGFAVNASTMGMAAAGLLVALVSRRINRRNGIWICLAVLALPTALLAGLPDLMTFTALRIAQGVFMATAFTLTMTYLAEQCSAKDAAAALAAYITGGVASNLIGRLVAASVADMFGLATTFTMFAALNLAGAVLVIVALGRTAPMAATGPSVSPLAAWWQHLRNPALRSTFAIGFLVLFVFIGTFTYVNFVLVEAPIGLGAMELGFVYLVFLPSIVTTPMAGRTALRFGTRRTFWGAIAVAVAGLPLVVAPNLIAVLAGLALIGVGTFFAQAVATGFISRAAKAERGAASGLYLASYYAGGLAGAFVLGQVFDRLGWTTCVLVIAVALGGAALLARRLTLPAPAA